MTSWPPPLNYTLDNLSKLYYIKHGSEEQKSIDASVVHLHSNLKSWFVKAVLKVEDFGSYKRDTILPRKYDEHSDVDLLVFFDHGSINITPNAYRDRLVKFAENKYPQSVVYRSSSVGSVGVVA